MEAEKPRDLQWARWRPRRGDAGAPAPVQVQSPENRRAYGVHDGLRASGSTPKAGKGRCPSSTRPAGAVPSYAAFFSVLLLYLVTKSCPALLQPHGRQPLGHSLFVLPSVCRFPCLYSLSLPPLTNPSVCGNSQARILEWGAIFSFRGTSRPRDHHSHRNVFACQAGSVGVSSLLVIQNPVQSQDSLPCGPSVERAVSLQSPLRSGHSSTFHTHTHKGWNLDLCPPSTPLQADSLLTEPLGRPVEKAVLARNQTRGNCLEGG